ncbi:EAL domain-containing protein [Paraglaciecola aquimarina]|uniref:EAL domain-containing protein n=1 Tax=Paraglaciecola aquimarina TaxID=1235557 RepID=A0ABU3SU53_9ALTE|nr:EAL domain-containing protein [Paraglaciecola aquimarina]MDU0353528.1 EAL domain-containing protein [Paraglaciecola aquimarina]
MVNRLLSNIFIETLEQAIDSVVVIDSNNHILLYNHAAEKLWGYTKEEVIGQNVRVLVPDNLKANHDNLINNNRKTGVNKIVGTSREVPIMCKDGGQKWGAMSISKVHSDGKILYTAFIKDVTEAVKNRKHLELLSLVTDQTDNAIIIVDNNWRIIYVNQGFTTLFGYSDFEVIGHSPISAVAPHIPPVKVDEIKEHHLAGQSTKIDEMLQTKTGERLWCSVVSNPILSDEGELTHAVMILSEITKTKLHEILHQKILMAIAYDEPLERIMDNACSEISNLSESITPAILKLNDENQLQLLSAPKLPPSYRKLLNKMEVAETTSSAGCAIYRGCSVLSADIASDPLWSSEYKNALERLAYTGCLSVPIKGSDGEAIGAITFYYKNEKTPSDLHQDLLNVLGPLCTLAIEREKQRESIKKLAYYDPLTKLPNRRLLYANAEHILQEASNNKTKLAFLFLDLDRFKQVNDTYGHATGDQLLKAISERLTEVGNNHTLVGRLSGDEFVAVTPFRQNEELNIFVEELKQKTSLPLTIEGNKFTPSMSIGISTFPDDGRDIGTLIQRADVAMYQAKTSGRGRFTYFSHELNQLAQDRQELEVDLEKAIKDNVLELHYQPQISIEDGKICGVEALARWDHPRLGQISPSKFIPIAEDCGLIEALNQWAIHSACKQMASWKEQKIDIPRVSVNLSLHNFHNINLCELILGELDNFNLAPSCLILELTENVLLDTNPSTIKVLLDIHESGISFSMDDFGTGYSSLSYLQKIPIKELKLDRSFVSDIENDNTSRALSKAILQIGKSLNIKVVAEGIENKEQYGILKSQGYHIAQGYLFSHPLNSTKLETWITNVFPKD